MVETVYCIMRESMCKKYRRHQIFRQLLRCLCSMEYKETEGEREILKGESMEDEEDEEDEREGQITK